MYVNAFLIDSLKRWVFMVFFFFTFEDDLTFQKSATQSHTYPNNFHAFDAINAIDGNTSTCMRTNPFGSSSPDKTVWWKVDLGGVYNIYNINFLFKNYDGYGIYFYIS